MTPDDLENLRKLSICADQFGDGMTIVPQALLVRLHSKIQELQRMLLICRESVRVSQRFHPNGTDWSKMIASIDATRVPSSTSTPTESKT